MCENNLTPIPCYHRPSWADVLFNGDLTVIWRLFDGYLRISYYLYGDPLILIWGLPIYYLYGDQLIQLQVKVSSLTDPSLNRNSNLNPNLNPDLNPNPNPNPHLTLTSLKDPT